MPLKPMIRPSLGAVACFAWLLALAGCEDASKKPVQAHVPALAPALAPASAAPEVGALPLRNLVSQPLITLQAPVPGGIDYLIEKVKEKFSSGEANYQAGHLEAARRDFDDAVDWMLESGYDPNSDARLSELFHQVTDTMKWPK
jgi:membrane-bound lytic murein transglycosylase D